MNISASLQGYLPSRSTMQCPNYLIPSKLLGKRGIALRLKMHTGRLVNIVLYSILFPGVSTIILIHIQASAALEAYLAAVELPPLTDAIYN
jgi:hypothetical protein